MITNGKVRINIMAKIAPMRKLLLLIPVIILLSTRQAQAYIGPGAGIVVAGSFLVIFTTILSALVGFFIWPIRYFLRIIRGRNTYAKSRVKRVVILGLDGMDHALTEKYLAQGKLPNFTRLRDKGCFKKLATTIPSMSPVAWSSFQTGVNPGKHNIFDFLAPNRQTYKPQLSSVEMGPVQRKLGWGKFSLTLRKVDIRLLRKSQPFWKLLGERGIFSHIIRVPITYPPEKFKGVMLSGMCVPDLRGSQGTFSIYSTKIDNKEEYTSGEIFHLKQNGKGFRGDLLGPLHSRGKEGVTLKCPFEISAGKKQDAVLKVNGARYRLRQGVASEWVKVKFKAGSRVKISGICKFLLRSMEPNLEMYVTPIHIDPEKPVMPISHPTIYSIYLAKRQGVFGTLGLAEDSWALNEKFLRDEDFLEQCIQLDREREAMFFDSLEKAKRGLCVCVFDGMDRIQHTFWREIDKEHPLYQETKNGDRKNAIEMQYKRMDDLVGRVLSKCDDKNTLLMVISDHGFSSFRYGVDLNRWLEDNGYLAVKDGTRDNAKHLEAIDWSQTRAYAVGLSGIYLNLKGREAQGIVHDGPEADQLREEIITKLLELTDTVRDTKAVKQVYNARKTFKGPYTSQAPDLLVGFHKGYRASWETAIGKVTEQVFHDNTKAWSGDHCIDASLVPGILFCNRRIQTEQPYLMDIGPTVLTMFGLSVPKYMDGKSLEVAQSNGDNPVPSKKPATIKPNNDNNKR